MSLSQHAFKALQSVADEAFLKALPYFSQKTGWVPLMNINNMSFSMIPQEPDNVVKVEGSINKKPDYIVKYFVAEIVRLRKQFEDIAVDTEYVAEFPDGSRVLKEGTNYPGVGVVHRHVYFSTRIVDGNLFIVSAPAKLPEYPEPLIGLNYMITKTVATDSGSEFTMITQKDVRVKLTNEQKLLTGQSALKFYIAIMNDLSSRPSS